MKTISVIVPCYNEEESIPLFYEEVSKTLKTIQDVNYELVFVNDGSKDHSEDIMRTLGEQDEHVAYYSFSRNFGKEAAMFAGLEKAIGDYVVIMDADLQHPPHLLPQMYKAIVEQGYDCCAGKRIDRQGEGKVRNFLSRSFYKVIQHLTQMDMSDGAGDYRMMTRQMVDSILELKEYNRYLKGIFSFVGYETKWIEFHNVERVAGNTKWNIRSLFAYALEGIFSFSAKPILYALPLGIILFFISGMIWLYMIINSWFIHDVLSSTWWLSSLIVFMSGLQLVFIGILGHYQTRSYFEGKKRPIYIIKNTNRK